MIFAFIVIAALVFLSSSVLWLWLQAPQLMGLANMLFEWCQSFASICVSTTPVAMAALSWAAALVLGSGIVYAFARQARSFVRSSRALSALPVADGGKSVVLIKDDSVATAFTLGILRPKIYISIGMIKQLTRAELRAVVLHEAHHRRQRDPLRFFLAAVLKDIFFYIPIGAHLAVRLRSLRERAADDCAVSRTQDPLNLAGALLKVARSGAHLAGHGAFFKGEPVEGRISRLVEGKEQSHPSAPVWAVATSAVAGLVLAFSLLLPMAAHGRYEQVFCSKGHCSTMAAGMASPMAGHGGHGAMDSMASMDCKTHCETHR